MCLVSLRVPFTALLSLLDLRVLWEAPPLQKPPRWMLPSPLTFAESSHLSPLTLYSYGVADVVVLVVVVVVVTRLLGAPSGGIISVDIPQSSLVGVLTPPAL